MRNVLLLLGILFALHAGAQEPVFAEVMPSFPGGELAFQKFIDSVMVYPDSAQKEGRQGTVFVYFEVAKDGACANFKVAKGVPGSPDLDAEALRILRLMPRWNPGKMNGRAVKVGMTVPIRFVLA